MEEKSWSREHGGEIVHQKSWSRIKRRNHEGEIMKEEEWSRHHGGEIMERNHGGEMMKERP